MKTASVICLLSVVQCVLSQQGRNFTVHGSTYEMVDMPLSFRTWVTFQVQTSQDATVGLFTSIFTHRFKAYEIVIGAGDNTYTCIRKFHHDQCVQRTNIRGLVSADELRWFWIFWQNSSISYGTGNQRDENIIGWYNDSSASPVHFMKIRSYGDNSGFWVIPEAYFVLGYRLTGNLVTEGRLEVWETVYGKDYWVPYAVDRFDDHDAGVACFMLGFGRSGMIERHRHGQLADKPRILVECNGYESTLSECHPYIFQSTTSDAFISCNNTVIFPAAVEKDSKLLVHPNGTDGIHGNSVLRRNASANANREFTSWINAITALTSGILKSFYLFIEKISTDPSLKRLQIWRQVSESEYSLIWEKIANFSGEHRDALYKFDVSEDNFEVADGDYIGWVNEDSNAWISASRCSSAEPCQCSRSYDFSSSYDWPVVNWTTAFECSPYNFSVAVDIQPFTADTTMSSLLTDGVALSTWSSTSDMAPVDVTSSTVISSTSTRMIIIAVAVTFALSLLSSSLLQPRYGCHSDARVALFNAGDRSPIAISRHS